MHATQENYNEELSYLDAPVQDIMRYAREYYGLTLDDIEKAIRIKASQIHAIEEGRFHDLPGKVYAVGFIRTYAEYLRLNPDHIVDMYKSQARFENHANENIVQFPAKTSQSNTPKFYVIAAALLAFTIILGGWVNMNHPADPLTNMNIAQPQIQTQASEIKTLNADTLTQPLYN